MLRLRRGKWHGPRLCPKQWRRQRSPVFLTSLGGGVDLEAEATAREKEKSIAAKRVAAEAGAETRVRVEAKAEVRDWYVGILVVVLNKFKAASNGLNRAMVGSKEDTKEKL